MSQRTVVRADPELAFNGEHIFDDHIAIDLRRLFMVLHVDGVDVSLGVDLADNIRTFDTQFGNLRRDASKNIDLSLGKNFAFGERRYVQLRLETFNTTNHVTLGAPSISPTTTAFGTISTQSNSPRALQVGLRFVW